MGAECRNNSVPDPTFEPHLTSATVKLIRRADPTTSRGQGSGFLNVVLSQDERHCHRICKAPDIHAGRTVITKKRINPLILSTGI